jgi:hypothetical protein
MSKVYTGDTGTVIVLDCGQNVSTATARSIAVRKPDGTTTSWTAVAEGTDSIKYTSVAETFDQAGDYQLQALVTLPSGAWRGETAMLRVYSPFA